MTSKPQQAKAPVGTCPICGRPTEIAFRPFCSRRCADVDLSRWLKGAYAIPGSLADADEDGDAASITRQHMGNGEAQSHEDE